MTLRKAIGFLVIIMVVYWIVSDPVKSGTTINHLIHQFTLLANGFGQFLGAL